MNKTIYKTWGLLSRKEEEDYKKDMLECYMDTRNLDIEDYVDEEDFEDYCRDCWDEYFKDDFGSGISNTSCSKINDDEYVVIGELGLWDGKHKIVPTEFNSLVGAVHGCLGRDTDDFEIMEDRYGNLKMNCYHHDGCNRFTIKRKTDKGLRCVNWSKNVWGC